MAATLDTIAQRLGVSRPTVSLALRDSPRISASVRARVAALAAELGYVPNPLIQALMVGLRTRQPAPSSARLCFLTAHPTRDGWRDEPVFRRQHAAAVARARALGYQLETHWAREPGVSPARRTRILLDRDISGLLVAPLPHGASAIDLDWDRFASVALGHTFRQVAIHRVTNHHFHSALLALETCHDRGYRRIGLALPAFSDARVNHLWLAGFLAFQATRSDVPRLSTLIVNPLREPDFAQWVHRVRPEVVVTTEAMALTWLQSLGLGVPGDVACVHLDWTAERGEIAGVDQRPEATGEAAIDLLVEQINQNRRGQPDVAQTVLIESTWRDGPTLPPRIQNSPTRERRPASPCTALT